MADLQLWSWLAGVSFRTFNEGGLLTGGVSGGVLVFRGRFLCIRANAESLLRTPTFAVSDSRTSEFRGSQIFTRIFTRTFCSPPDGMVLTRQAARRLPNSLFIALNR